MKIERVSKYWICDECANKKEWVAPNWAVTFIRGYCGWCEREDETILTPTCDFKGKNKVAIWD